MNNQVQQASLNKSLVDKFRLVFNIPPALQGINKKLATTNAQIDLDTMQFSVHGSVIPEIEVPATEIRYAGSTLYNSSHSKNSYPPNNVTFDIDNGFKNYWVIWKWLNLLHDEAEGLFDQQDLAEDESYLEYMTNISISSMDEFNEPVLTWTFTKAFPVTLGGINYNYRDESQIECNFSFAYSQVHIKREGVQ